jgi:small nuclear ribonucleoprotein (snRNP)-like protein
MFRLLIISQKARSEMLQNLINGIMELQQVKNTTDQMGTTSGTLLTYDEYTTLLLSAASAYDDQFNHKEQTSCYAT